MTDQWTTRWNERYSQAEYAYGESPNRFLEAQLEKLPIGKMLFPAEGEGRNAVHAATLGWETSAFDISIEGQKKALQLAEKNGVHIEYLVGSIEDLPYQANSFDAIGLIYAHFPASIKAHYHQQLDKLLRVGGIIIFEAFSKNHLGFQAKNDKVGGPKDVDSLFSVEEIKKDFPNYEILQLEEVTIELEEGLYHNGQGAVIRFVGKKLS